MVAFVFPIEVECLNTYVLWSYEVKLQVITNVQNLLWCHSNRLTHVSIKLMRFHLLVVRYGREDPMKARFNISKQMVQKLPW